MWSHLTSTLHVREAQKFSLLSSIYQVLTTNREYHWSLGTVPTCCPWFTSFLGRALLSHGLSLLLLIKAPFLPPQPSPPHLLFSILENVPSAFCIISVSAFITLCFLHTSWCLSIDSRALKVRDKNLSLYLTKFCTPPPALPRNGLAQNGSSLIPLLLGVERMDAFITSLLCLKPPVASHTALQAWFFPLPSPLPSSTLGNTTTSLPCPHRGPPFPSPSFSGNSSFVSSSQPSCSFPPSLVMLLLWLFPLPGVTVTSSEKPETASPESLSFSLLRLTFLHSTYHVKSSCCISYFLFL